MNKTIELSDNVRQIARSAEHKIKRKTGMRVTLMLYPTAETTGTPEYMLRIIALALGMKPQCFRLKSRKRDIVELRFLGSLFLRMNFPAVTLHQIAGLFGGLDHSSVINGLSRAHNLLCSGDPKFMEKYNTVLKSVDLWLKREQSGFASASSA